MKRVIGIAAAVLGMTLFLFGCGTLTSPDNDLLKGYGIMKLTEEAVKGDPVKAEKVRSLAIQIRDSAADSEFVSVDLLIAEVRRQIPWQSLSPADTFFANEILRTWRQDLVNEYGDGVLPGDLRLSVEKVAGWVILAAQP